MAKYDVALLEKPAEDGLTRTEIEMLLDKLETKSKPLSVYPIEIENSAGESSAMGFITTEGAEKICFMYDDSSELGCKIRSILADMDNERPDKTYQFGDITVFLDR